MIKMNRNKEYRLKRKAQRKDYIIQDKNLTIKTLYYRNETKRNKIEQLEQKNKQLQNNWNELKNGLKSLFDFDEGVVSKDYLECAEDTLEKMQELQGEGNNES